MDREKYNTDYIRGPQLPIARFFGLCIFCCTYFRFLKVPTFHVYLLTCLVHTNKLVRLCSEVPLTKVDAKDIFKYRLRLEQYSLTTWRGHRRACWKQRPPTTFSRLNHTTLTFTTFKIGVLKSQVYQVGNPCHLPAITWQLKRALLRSAHCLLICDVITQYHYCTL